MIWPIIHEKVEKSGKPLILNYRTRAIITRGLYIFYPLFEVQKRFFKELFFLNSGLMYG